MYTKALTKSYRNIYPLKTNDMTIKKSIHGTIQISDIVNGIRVERQYVGYSVRDAVARFKQAFRLPSNNTSAQHK